MNILNTMINKIIKDGTKKVTISNFYTTYLKLCVRYNQDPLSKYYMGREVKSDGRLIHKKARVNKKLVWVYIVPPTVPPIVPPTVPPTVPNTGLPSMGIFSDPDPADNWWE